MRDSSPRTPPRRQGPVGDVRDIRGNRIELSPILPLLARCQTRLRPTQTWLFGSRARGQASVDSDWDLLVVVPDETSEDELDPVALWRMTREARVCADVVVCRASEFEDARRTHNTLAYEATTSGVRIDER